MDRYSEMLERLGLSGSRDGELAALLDADEARLGALPDVLRRVYEASGFLDRVGGWCSNTFEAPGRLRLHPQRSPGGSPCLWLATENQAVCDWIAPLDQGDDPPVYVVGELFSGETMVEYASSLADFLTSIAWDVAVLSPPPGVPMIQAQAAELDSAALAWLRNGFDEGIETRGWPCQATYRFRRRDQAIELWSCTDQCDWWIVAGSLDSLENLVREVLDLSDLTSSMWSNEPSGDALLARVRSNIP